VLQAQPYAILLFGAAALSGWVGVYAWRRRAATPAAAALTLAMAGLVWWSGTEALGFSFTDVNVQWGFALAIYPGVGAAVVGLVWFLRVIVDPGALFSRRTWLLLGVEPVVITVLAALNPWLHLVAGRATRTSSGLLMSHDPGPAFWLHSAYSYLLVVWAVTGVVRALRTVSDLRRRQLRTMLLSIVPTFATTTVTLALLLRDSGVVDLSGVGFAATCLIDAWALFRQALLRLVPIARAQVIDAVGDAVVVIDQDQRVLDLNPAAVRIARGMRPDLPVILVGLPARRLLPIDLVATRVASGAHTVRVDGAKVTFDVRFSRLTGRHGNLVGEVVVARDITEITQRRRELADANSRLREQLTTIEQLQTVLAEQAVRDVLTGVHNRRHLMVALEREVKLARSAAAPLGVILLDIDHFKAVNDDYGHTVGDNLLAAIANALAQSTRETDTIARYGGEEFVVVIPGASIGDARSRAEDLRRRCSTVTVPGGKGTVTVTLSAGIAAYPESGTTPLELLEAADDAMYEAKRTGRDRVSAQPVP
jgi:diguanylate cyclase (GGDEF)-like protein